MVAKSEEILRNAPKTGPWILGYAATIGIAFAGAGTQTVGALFNIVTSLAAVACVGMIIFTSWRRHRMLGTLSSACRRFWSRAITSAAFSFLGFCAFAFAQHAEWSETPLAYLAALPYLGFAGLIWATHQYPIDENDEYLRRQALQQLVIAGFATLTVMTLWSALTAAHLVGSGRMNLVVLIWFLGLGLGRLLIESKM